MNLLEMAGAQPQKQPKYAPLFMDRMFTGLFTQRALLHDPADLATARFYGGRPDALLDGSNVELTNRLTLQRRPGLSAFSTATYPTPPDRAFSFELTNGTIQVIIDTASAVYIDNQNGTKTLLFNKSAGAGQTYFVAVAGVLYMGDGIDTRKYTPGNANGTVWNWGGAAPVNPPTVSVVETASASVTWTASTFYSTMGLLFDSNGNIQALTSVNSTTTNTTQYGKTGNGQPVWNNTTGGTTTDNTVTWTCAGPLKLRLASTLYTAGDCIFVPSIGGLPPPVITGAGNNVTFHGTNGGSIWMAYIGGFSGGGTATTGAGTPNWNPTTNTHTNDGGVQWQYLGPAQPWQPSTTYNSWWEHWPEAICEPTLPNQTLLQNNTQTIFIQTANNQTTGSNNTPGVSGTGYTPPWATTVGQTTTDGDLIWVCLGSGTWAATTSYSGWSFGQPTFSAIKDGNGNFQVCITTGVSQSTTPFNSWKASTIFATNAEIAVQSPGSGFVVMKVTAGGGGSSGATQPTWDYTTGHTTSDGALTWTSQGPTTVPVWSTSYGGQTKDGTAVWVCVGTAANSTWVASTQWYLPAQGFIPPTASQPYGGALIVANNDVQATIGSGLSGSSQPAFGAIGTMTTDNTVTWYTEAAFTAQSLTWTIGHVYAYSYKARTPTDPFVTTAPPGYPTPLGPPTGSETGLITTASPAFVITGANTGAVNTISGIGSTDPQFDTIVIWRDADGGGVDHMFELTEIPNPPPVNGQPQPWSFQDFLPDTATSLYPGLNNLIPAPIDDENDPPPSNFLPMVYNFQRIWGAQGQSVGFSGGPDVITGNPNEAFNPADTFPYLATVVRVVKGSAGLAVFLTDSIEFIAGGPLTSSFYSVTLAPGVGLQSYNALDIYTGELYFLSADGQFYVMTPSLNISNAGFAIGDKLVGLNPANVYVAVLQAGTDNCLFVADGSTGWYRLNPRQAPGGSNGPEPIWSPFANITGGCKMVQTVETSPGVKKLLVGSTSNSQEILKRDLSVYTDNGTAYDAFFTMGNIVLAHPGQLALLKFIECDFSGQSYTPTVSYLLNEIAVTGSAAFVAMSNPRFDPPSLYGTTITPQSYSPNRYDFISTGSLARARHLQIKVDFGTTSNGDEIYNLTIYGRLMIEE